ncbi:polysaccharide deacetylase family protein [Salirhabdus salicampi]|uniref:polysaccharide deacetylase family protein n=1 Tax=Salirhabdus salicampi TaxID=476102 RepID=UPI0020C28937|nr:polysaccharide deacetylase [Salirhabdus salicampi]MCP8615268.1 polysaccharide deacetylase [Salirhabdus salicampi]
MKWPNGKQMAVVLSFDVDAETAFTFNEKNKSRMSLLSIGTYGRTVGLNRILTLLSENDLKANFFVPGAVANIDPTVIERIVEKNHPIGHHGYFHERLDDLTFEEEEEIIVKGREAIKKYAGYYPEGYRAPLWEINRHTPSLLKKYDFRFDSSLMGNDVPYTIDGGHNEKILEIPVTWLLDDWEQFAFSAEPPIGFSIEEPDKVYRLWKAEFDGLYQDGGCFVLTMHPQLIGRSSRINMLNELIHYMKSKPGVWFTTLNEIEEKWSSGELKVEHSPFIQLD